MQFIARAIVPFALFALGYLAPVCADAQSTATPVVPGYLTTSGCTAGLSSCFVPYGPSGGGGGGSGGATTVLVPTGLAANAIAPVSSASAESCHVFKAAPGNVYGLSGYIGAAGFIYIQNVASAPNPGAIVPFVTPIYMPSAGTWSWTPPTGAPVLFTTGITVCASSTGPLTLTLYSTNTIFSGLFQ